MRTTEVRVKMKYLSVLVLFLFAGSSAFEWHSTTKLPRPSWRHACAASGGRVYFIGGSEGPETSCYFAAVNPDGTLGSWIETTALPVNLGWLSADATDDHIYACGGWNLGGLTSQVCYARLDSSGGICRWQTATSLPTALYTHGAIIVDSCLYVVGGATGVGSPVIADVRFARIQPDGSLGQWTATNPLSEPLRIMGVVHRDSSLYSIGGRTEGSATNAVYYCRRNPDGTLEPWQATAALPAATDGPTCAVVAGRVYCVAGMASSTLRDVYSAGINPDGSLEPWQADSPLPTFRWASDGLAVNGRIYVPGGYLSEPHDEVYYSSPLVAVSEPDLHRPDALPVRSPILIGPSVVRDRLRIQTSTGENPTVSVFNAAGKLVLGRTRGSTLDLGSLAPGVHFLRVRTPSQESQGRVIVLP